MPRCDLRLYGILDVDRLGAGDLPMLAREAAEGGATLLQLRAKSLQTGAFVTLARAVHLSLAGKVPLLINDRVDVARAAEAEGVHLGREDMAPRDARAILGSRAVIGVTLKDQTDLAALRGGFVDYGCIGGVFATQSKDNPEPPLGLSGLAALRRAADDVDLPIGAIAGIDANTTRGCIEAGADGIALIGALFLAPDVRLAARRLRAIIDDALRSR